MDMAPAGPQGRPCRAWILDLPEEVLLRVLRLVEDAYVRDGQSSAEFLDLRTVCKTFQRGVDSAITNLSRGIASKFCCEDRVLEVRDTLQRQLARWSIQHRVELHMRRSNHALPQFVAALGQTCPGLVTLRIVQSDLDPLLRETCHAVADLTSLTSLTSLSFTGCTGLVGTLPPLPSLRTLEADFYNFACYSPLPALEELVLGNRDRDSSGRTYRRSGFLQAPHLHTSSPRLRRLSIHNAFLEQLQLPKSLQVLDLANVELATPLDLSTELPDLAELQLVYDRFRGTPPINLQGLTTLLSRGSLRRLKLHGLGLGASPLSELPLRMGLTSLSLHSLLLAMFQLPETVATLTTLKDLTLTSLWSFKCLKTLDISLLQLQQLTLEGLPTLSSIKGLGLQTQLTSLVLKQLPLTDLPDLRTFGKLVTLKLTYPRLWKWNPGSCSCLPRIKLLHLAALQDTSPSTSPEASPSSSPRSSPQRVSSPATCLPDLSTLPTLTELSLCALPIPKVDVSPLLFLEDLDIRDCRRLSQLSGIHSLPHLRSVKLGGCMPRLGSLTVASCPRLTTLSCLLEDHLHVTLEDLPRLSDLASLPEQLHTRRVSSCPLLETPPLNGPTTLPPGPTML